VNILFVSSIDNPFVRDDLACLERHFTVRERIGHGILGALKVASGTVGSDVVFCWFASVYAFVAVAVGRLFGVRSVIVVGGVDVACEREIGYGIWLSPWRAPLVRYALRRADRVLVVDPGLKEDAMRLAEYDGLNISYLPTGFDGLFWRAVGEKEPFILTVAKVMDRRRMKVKGLDLLLEAARLCPEQKFVLIGVAPAVSSRLDVPPNMTVHPPEPRETILGRYRAAKVYCQPSRREGLPGALCEAMLCECIPVATSAGGCPTAVGDAGFLVPPGDARALAEGIRNALGTPAGCGAKARARIVALFPRERRENELVRMIRGLVR
jgi:glycosyltransferase involved in cell wall biosynthesis